MKIVIAIDSFKGSLSTLQAGAAVKEGFKKVFPDGEAVISPIADGGEGTLDAVVLGTGARIAETEVTTPTGGKRLARYGILPDGGAVVEIAEAAGLTLVSEDKRNPLYTTTFGVGEIILSALESGCRNFTVGLGGSATNDGGVGMLQALGKCKTSNNKITDLLYKCYELATNEEDITEVFERKAKEMVSYVTSRRSF